MHEIEWEDQIQPRLGLIWAYDPEGTVFANYARYHPAASSLPRAASWARNNAATREADFDAAGNLIGIQALSSSTGKFFQEDLDPRATDEYLIGGSRQFGSRWTGRLTARYRRSYNFWEDTNNNGRLLANAPPGTPQELYIPNLAQLVIGLGPGLSGNSYVIAELDNAFTKYYEATPEIEWRSQQGLLQRLLRLEPLLRQLRPGQHQRRLHRQRHLDLHRLLEPRRRRRPPALGQEVRQPRRRSPPPGQALRLPPAGLERQRRRLRHLPVGPAVGGLGRRGLPRLHRQHQQHDPLRRAGRVATRATITTSSISTTPRTSTSATASRSASRADIFNIFDKQTGYAIQPVVSNAAFGEPTEYFDPQRVRLTARLRF